MNKQQFPSVTVAVQSVHIGSDFWYCHPYILEYFNGNVFFTLVVYKKHSQSRLFA